MVRREILRQGLSIYSFMKHSQGGQRHMSLLFLCGNYIHCIYNFFMSVLTITPTIAEFTVESQFTHTDQINTNSGQQQSVNWSVDKCKSPERLFNEKGEPTPVTLCVMRHMALLGITKLTKTTAKEFYRRYKVYEYFKGPTMYQHDKPLFVNFGLICEFIGAVNNAEKVYKHKFWKIIECWVREKVHERINDEVKLMIEDRN